MAYDMKDLEFTLFKNDKKEADNHPDYTGKIMIDGKEMRMAAWIKQGKSGQAFFSGKVSEFKQNTTSAPVEDPINPPAEEKKPKSKRMVMGTIDESSSDGLPF